MSGGPSPSGSLARKAALAFAAGRIGLGIGAFAFTRPALSLLGFRRPSGAALVLARLAGVRDLALGANALAAHDDPARLRAATALATAVDAGDAVAFAAALIGRDGIDRTAVVNLPGILAAVAAGGWISARLPAGAR